MPEGKDDTTMGGEQRRFPEDTDFPNFSSPEDQVTPDYGVTPILARGTILDDFEILEEIGRGGMGIVYRARQVSLKRIVAIKVIDPRIAADPAAIRRFRREAVLAANLSHPNIVPVHYIDKEPRPCFFTMEFVEGESLRDIVEREGPLEPDRVIALALQACEALQYAHNHNVIHRDIKPSNLILERESGRLRITDFGIAQDVTGRLADATQTEGRSIGTPAFESPEQNQGLDLDRRTDIFSLGMTLYYLLTGKMAYEGKNRPEMARAFREQVPRAPSSHNAWTYAALDGIILKMLQADREGRYDTAGHIVDLLRRLSNASPKLAVSGSKQRRGAIGVIWRKLFSRSKERNSESSVDQPVAKRPRRRFLRITIEIGLYLLPISIIGFGAVRILLVNSLSSRGLSLEERTVHAIISRTDLPAGTQLTKAHVTVAEVPEEDLPVGYYTRIGEVIGRHLKVDVVEGQLLVESMLTAKMPNIMRPGTQPFHLSLSKRETGVSLLQPDCIANVYVTFLLRNKEEGGSVIIAPLLQQIRILTVDDRTITGPQRETSHSSSRAWNDGIVLLTLEVTDLQTRALELAQRMGKLTLHLRNPTDTRSYPGTVLLLEANGSVSTKRDCDPEDPLGMINYARVIGAAVSVPGIPDLTGAGSADQLP